MKHTVGAYIAAILATVICTLSTTPGWAGEPRANHGNDPFFQVSSAISGCPVPLGPLRTEQEWLADSHYRVERGNSCWWEGRCRLSNSYLYDREIQEAVKRRLTNIEPSTHWREQTTLWLVLQRRFIYVQGCVSPDFNKQAFLSGLAKTADVERVIDQTTAHGASDTLPYRTLDNPDKLAYPHEGG